MDKWIRYFCIFLAACLLFPYNALPQKKGKRSSDALKDTLTAEKKEQLDFYFFEALAKKNLEQYNESIQIFKEVLKIQPKHTATLYLLAEIYSAQKNSELALSYAEKAYELEPQNLWYAKLIASLYTQNQQPQKAIRVYENYAKTQNNDIEMQFLLAELYLQTNEFRKAIIVYDSIQQKLGVIEDIAMQKHRIYLLLNEPEKAIQEIQSLVSHFPYEPKYYYLLYELYLKNNQTDKAIHTLELLQNNNPQETLSLFKLADFFKNQKNYEKEFYYLEKAFQNPLIPTELKAEYLQELLTQEPSDAHKAFVQKLLKTLPNTPQNQSLIAIIQADLAFYGQQIDSARVYYLKVLQDEPENAVLWNKLLEIDTRLEKPELILKDALQALEYFPNEPAYHYYAGFAYYQLKNYANTIKYLEKLLKFLDNEDNELLLDVWNLLANAYYYEKKFAKSDEYFNKILKLEPDDLETLNNYAYYLACRNERLDEAFQMIKKVIAIDAQNPAYQDTYGWVLFQQKRYDEAKQWIEKAYNQKKSADIAEHLGDVWFVLGNKNKAIELWKEAQKLGNNSQSLAQKIQNGTL